MQGRILKFNRILKIREDLRRDEQAILASERSEEQQVLKHLDELANEKSKAIMDFSKPGEKALSSNELWFQRQFISAIDSDIQRGNNSLNDVRTRIAGTEARLVERHRDVKIMETYIGKLKEADFQERLGIEQNELDDMATMQFSRVKINQGVK